MIVGFSLWREEEQIVCTQNGAEEGILILWEVEQVGVTIARCTFLQHHRWRTRLGVGPWARKGDEGGSEKNLKGKVQKNRWDREASGTGKGLKPATLCPQGPVREET